MASNGDHASPSAAAEQDSAAASTTTTSAAAMDAMRDLNLRMSKKVAQLTKVISHLNARSEEQLFDLQDMSQHYESEMEVRAHPPSPPSRRGAAHLPTPTRRRQASASRHRHDRRPSSPAPLRPLRAAADAAVRPTTSAATTNAGARATDPDRVPPRAPPARRARR